LSVALCFPVTAFPVLLRIVEENGVSRQPVGILSIGISAVLELLVWASLPIILAVVTAGSPIQAGQAIAWVGCFLLAWFTLVRRMLKWQWGRIPAESLTSLFLLAVVGISSAIITERLGIHAIFGAFVGGLAVPREVSFLLAKKIKPAYLFLLPIFFAAAGLKTALNFGGRGEILIVLGLLLLAYFVKVFGTTLFVKLTGGLNWNEAATVGHLMCAKGAIGFAILEICLSAGLLDTQGYSMLAFVILANTVMAAWGVGIQRQWTARQASSAMAI
jgi:Kef-type K+ transport system membrane component KefB